MLVKTQQINTNNHSNNIINNNDNQQPTTNNQQPTTNNQQPTTNNQQQQLTSRDSVQLWDWILWIELQQQMLCTLASKEQWRGGTCAI